MCLIPNDDDTLLLSCSFSSQSRQGCQIGKIFHHSLYLLKFSTRYGYQSLCIHENRKPQIWQHCRWHSSLRDSPRHAFRRRCINFNVISVIAAPPHPIRCETFLDREKKEHAILSARKVISTDLCLIRELLVACVILFDPKPLICHHFTRFFHTIAGCRHRRGEPGSDRFAIARVKSSGNDLEPIRRTSAA